MGSICCRGSSLTQHDGAIFGGGYNTGRGLPQLLLLGPEGSGKTTLLYSTVVPGWSNITTAMEPTVAFHYEEILRSTMKFGIWDVSGSFATQPLWPLFYRYIAFDGLVFVVSVLDSNLSATREWIRRLLNEDELRTTQIIVLINTFDQSQDDVNHRVELICRSLGLSELKTMIDYPERFSWFVANVKDGERDTEWSLVLSRFVQWIQMKYGVGGYPTQGASTSDQPQTATTSALQVEQLDEYRSNMQRENNTEKNGVT